MSEEKRKTNIGFTILKIFLIVVLFVVLILVGGYFYVKYSLGIDIGKFKRALDLLNKNYLQTQIITDKYTNEDTNEAFIKLFGENEIYVKEGTDYTFDKNAFEASTIQQDTILSNKEFAGLLNIFLKNYIKELEDTDVNLRQVIFSNLTKEELVTSVEIKYTFEIKFYNSNEDENFLASIFTNNLPSKILLTSRALLNYSNSDCFDYSIANISFNINNLSKAETNEVLDVFSSLGIFNFKEGTANNIDEIFFSSIFGGESTEGLIANINNCIGYEFLLNEDEIFLKLKKV